MYTTPTKKLLLLNILNILKKHTDVNHKLSQKKIEEYLLKEYSMKADRKSVKRNLMNLDEFGYYIGYDTKERKIKRIDPISGEEFEEISYTYTNFYLKRDFNDFELRYLIDLILYSDSIPAKWRKDLIKKLENLSSEHFKKQMGYVDTVLGEKSYTSDFFLNVEVLHDAINGQKKVSFSYCEYGTDKVLHEICDDTGSPKKYVVSPHQLMMKDGKYVLLCITENGESACVYRVDYIKGIEKLDDVSNRLNAKVDKNCIHARLRVAKSMIGDVIDSFGKEIKIVDEADLNVTVMINAEEEKILRFAKAFMPDVVVLGPDKLVEKVKVDLENATKQYT